MYIHSETKNFKVLEHFELRNGFLVNDQRDAQILFYVFISIYNSLHVSSTSCSKYVESYK